MGRPRPRWTLQTGHPLQPLLRKSQCPLCSALGENVRPFPVSELVEVGCVPQRPEKAQRHLSQVWGGESPAGLDRLPASPTGDSHSYPRAEGLRLLAAVNDYSSLWGLALPARGGREGGGRAFRRGGVALTHTPPTPTPGSPEPLECARWLLRAAPS